MERRVHLPLNKGKARGTSCLSALAWKGSTPFHPSTITMFVPTYNSIGKKKRNCMPNMALARVINGWNVYNDTEERLLSNPEDHAFVRDIDLAERAGLVDTRDIRRTIQGCINRGLISPAFSSVGNAHAATDSVFVEVMTTVPRGNRGATQTVREFYLSEAAALHVIMHLETDRAVQLQRDVVRVYIEYRNGNLTSAAPVLPPPPPPNPFEMILAPIVGELRTLVAFVLRDNEQLRDRLSEAELRTRTISPSQQTEMRYALRRYQAAIGAKRFSTAEGRYREHTGLPGYTYTLFMDFEENLAMVNRWTSELGVTSGERNHRVQDDLPQEENPNGVQAKPRRVRLRPIRGGQS